MKAHIDNSSGLLGVSWREQAGKWRASIGINGRHRHLGYFENKEDAHQAYKAAKLELHTFQPTIR